MTERMSEYIFAGVDYGSKMAGTTVVACYDGKSLCFFSSEKKKDADAFLLKTLPTLKVQLKNTRPRTIAHNYWPKMGTILFSTPTMPIPAVWKQL